MNKFVEDGIDEEGHIKMAIATQKGVRQYEKVRVILLEGLDVCEKCSSRCEIVRDTERKGEN